MSGHIIVQIPFHMLGHPHYLPVYVNSYAKAMLITNSVVVTHSNSIIIAKITKIMKITIIPVLIGMDMIL